MKLITRDTDYAVRILCYMAGHKEKLSVADMAKELDIPMAFLRRITQNLSKWGLARSRKGFNGGFNLVVDPEKIRLVDIMEIFQGSFSIKDCMFKKKICPNRQTCFLRKQLSDIESYAFDKLADLTIARIVEESSNG